MDVTRRRLILGVTSGGVLGALGACDLESPDSGDGPDGFGGVPQERGPRIDVLAEGVSADGISDDTAAMARLIEKTASAGGGRLLIPKGRMVRVRALKLASGVSIVGGGAASGLTKIGNSAKWITCTRGARSVILTGLRLECSVLARASMIEVSSGVRGFLLDNCEVIDSSRRRTSGLETRDGVVGVWVRNCSFRGQSAAIKINKDPRGVHVESNSFEGWAQRAIQALGTSESAVEDITISRNSIGPNVGNSSVRQPIQFNGHGDSPFLRVRVVDNTLRGRGTAYSDPISPGTADMISLHECHGFEVARNECSDGGEVGITIARQCRDGKVTDNRVVRCDSAGIVIGSGSTVVVSDIEVRGNVLTDNGLDRAAKGRPSWARAGVVVYRGKSVRVVGNRMTNKRRGHVQEYGVTVTDGEAVDVTENQVSDVSKSKVLRRRSKSGEPKF